MSNFITNYHWKTRDTSKWAKTWLEAELAKIDVEGLKVGLLTIEGDCELGMRKAKLITIYDLRLETNWSGLSSSGTFTIPEVSHDMDLKEYVFESSPDASCTPEALQLARTKLADEMRNVFARFGQAMVETHGAGFYKDNGVSPAGTPGQSGTTTPVVKAAPTGPPGGAVGIVAEEKVEKKTVNVKTVRVDDQFMASAQDLFDLMTKEDKIPMWSRNAAKMKLEVGGEMSLFGGNITGKVLAVEAPKSITTTWRAPSWPAGHFGEMKSTFDQGSDSTTLRLELKGVPLGQVEETERNLDIFYIRSLKQIGSALPPLPPSHDRWRRSSSPPDYPTPIVPPSKWSLVLTSAIPMAISVGLIAALGGAIWLGPTGEGIREAWGKRV